ncbi:Histone H2A, C-terminal domain [Sesbania bispinosa]|nr:Histone H2A, C-terminal domain [Sesbania bispinosa]
MSCGSEKSVLVGRRADQRAGSDIYLERRLASAAMRSKMSLTNEFHDGHGLGGDTGVGVHLLEDFIDCKSRRTPSSCASSSYLPWRYSSGPCPLFRGLSGSFGRHGDDVSTFGCRDTDENGAAHEGHRVLCGTGVLGALAAGHGASPGLPPLEAARECQPMAVQTRSASLGQRTSAPGTPDPIYTVVARFWHLFSSLAPRKHIIMSGRGKGGRLRASPSPASLEQSAIPSWAYPPSCSAKETMLSASVPEPRVPCSGHGIPRSRTGHPQRRGVEQAPVRRAIAQGGVLPNIQAVLLPKKTEKKPKPALSSKLAPSSPQSVLFRTNTCICKDKVQTETLSPHPSTHARIRRSNFRYFHFIRRAAFPAPGCGALYRIRLELLRLCASSVNQTQ